MWIDSLDGQLIVLRREVWGVGQVVPSYGVAVSDWNRGVVNRIWDLRVVLITGRYTCRHSPGLDPTALSLKKLS